MKIVVIGGGSTYTPELVTGFLERICSLPLQELWLTDINEERLDIVGGLSSHMVKQKGSPFEVRLSTNTDDALQDASYVITQLRVGCMEARRNDEYLGRRHNLIGQETTGIGGMANALRTIPVVLDIANKIENIAPDALLVNFTNPSGLVTQALSQHAPNVSAVGLCNDPITSKMRIIQGFRKNGIAIQPGHAQLDTLGLNHLTWHRGFTVDGEDLWPQVMQGLANDMLRFSKFDWDIDTVMQLGMLPNNYLQYYYYTQECLHKQKSWPPSRAEKVMEIEKELLQEYSDPNIDALPPSLMQRGGAYYSTVATQLINAHYNDLREIHTVNICQGDAVKEWPADWVLELPCEIGRDSIRPLPTNPLPAATYGLLAHVKQYELLTVQAAVNQDRRSAYQAILVHPLGPPSDKVEELLVDLLETNSDYLGEYK